MLRILVCGGRDYTDKQALFDELDNLVAEYHETSNGGITIISGEARGADALASQWAAVRRHHYEGYPADWEKHGKAAGPIRNQQMLTEGKPDLVVAFPGGRGTSNMVTLAEMAGVPVYAVSAASSKGPE